MPSVQRDRAMMDPKLTEGEAWHYFQEAIDDLRTILRARDMEFTVEWKMTARPRKPKKVTQSQRHGEQK